MRILAFADFTILILSIFSCEKPLPHVAEEAPVVGTLGEVVMNDSIWRVDSAKVWYLWERYWFFDDNNRHDSAIAVCRKLIDVGEPMMAYRFDSTIYEKYAKAYGGIGYNLMGKGQLEEGLKFTQESWDLIHEKFGDNQPRNTELCTGFTFYYVKKGDFNQALNYCDKSFNISVNSIKGLHYYQGNIYSNYAWVCEEKNDWKGSISYIQKAIDVYKKTAPPAMLEAYHRLGNSYLQIGDFQKAKASAGECIRLATEDHEWKKIGYVRFPTSKKKDEWHYFDLPNVYLLLGSVCRELGEYENSLVNIKTGIKLALKDWEKSGDVTANGWLELGKTYIRTNEPALAMDAFRKVEPLLEKYAGKGKEYATLAWREAGSLQLLLGFPDSAVFYFQKALVNISPSFQENQPFKNAPLEELEPSILLLESLYAKAHALEVLFKRSGDRMILATSLETFALAADLSDKMRHRYKWQDSKESLSGRALPIFEGAIETALELNRVNREEKYLQQALNFTERSKAFTLLENLQTEKAKTFAGIPMEMLVKEESVSRELALYQRFILEEEQNIQNTDSSKLNYWHDKLIDLKKSQDSLLAIFEKNYPEYHRLKYENPIASLAQIQNRLKPNETLIEYFLGDSTLYTFTVNQAGLNYHQQTVDSNFLESVNRLRHFASTPSRGSNWTTDYQQYITDARYLYQILLEPALGNNSSLVPQSSSLVIVPDGVLNFLPFNLLLTKDPDSLTLTYYDYRNLPYLVRDFDIRYEYSATLMVESQRSKKGSFRQHLWQEKQYYCGFAPAYGNGEVFASRGEDDSLKLAELYPGILQRDFGALRFNQPEVEAASQTLEGTPFLGSSATEAAFKQQAENAKVLHLAMHALTNDKEPLFSQLAFSKDETDTTEDGRLHAYELYNMRMKADLAVLSACNTGAGKLQRGEGVMSLSRAFKYAGCPNVVMSLWQADDRSTQTIVTDFFKNLKAGMGKDRALCQAQREFVKTTENQDLTHPYFWSTLMLIGDGEPLHRGISGWALLVVCIVILLFLGWVVRKKSILKFNFAKQF